MIRGGLVERVWLRGCTEVGAEPRLRGRPTVENYGGRIEIGDRFSLASRPVRSHLVAGPEGILSIGVDVAIGHGAAIAAFERVDIGDNTQIGPFVIVMDTNFHGASGDQSVRHDCRPVTIGRGCRIGSRVTITRGASIGDRAEVLAGSVVSSTIPPGVCAAGARARVIGRAGDQACGWDGAAVLLLELAAATLGAAPDLTDRCGAEEWSADQVGRLVSAIHQRWGVALDPAFVRGALTWTEIADALERIRRE